MQVGRISLLTVLAASCGFAADSAAVTGAATRFETLAAQATPAVAKDLRETAAEMLQPRHPDLARRFPAAAPAAPAIPPASRPAAPAPSGEFGRVRQLLAGFRGLPTDADRARRALEVVAIIQSMPPGRDPLNLTMSLCNLATEGDLGADALGAVAAMLGRAIQAAPPDASAYSELAKLIRYEHVAAPFHDASLDASDALLALQEAIQQDNGFTLTALDGKTYTLDGLRGKVVMLNFWATWCPPCRKEMPDMEKLYREMSAKGLVVLAVSDEERPVVEKFLADKHYSFPILLDPGRTVNTAYLIRGIPKTFLFDRQGKLVAQSIDMRTEAQFRAMLKQAGL